MKGPDGRTVKIPRFVYEAEHGPTSLYILHTCDYPPCFERSHLYAGTQSANMKDMYARDRRGTVDTRPRQPLTGDRNPNWRGGITSDMRAYQRAWRAHRSAKAKVVDGVS